MQQPNLEALIGRVLGGTYRVEAQLGAGGMGAVFEATHLRTGRAYAVKVLLPEVAARRDAVARFRREAEAVGALGHANVVAIHDFAVEEQLAYLVMDRLEGEDLAARLERVGRLSLEATLSLLEGMAAGLEAAHRRGLIHRDLKPANVFLARQPGAPERPVLLDFGLAKSFASEGDLSKLTVSGVVMGTPQYMSPEQAYGGPLDARADLYSLATIAYEMLAGRPPFEAPTLPALFAKLATDPPTPIEVHRGDLPPGVSPVLHRALAKSPADRYPDATSFTDALRAAATGIVPRTAPRPAGGASLSATVEAATVEAAVEAAAAWSPAVPPTSATPRGVDALGPTLATPAGVRPHPEGAAASDARGIETPAEVSGGERAEARAPEDATPVVRSALAAGTSGVDAHAPTLATPAGVDAHRTAATPAGRGYAATAETPSGTPRAAATAPRRSPWLLVATVGAILAFAIAGGGLALFVHERRGVADQASPSANERGTPVGAARPASPDEAEALGGGASERAETGGSEDAARAETGAVSGSAAFGEAAGAAPRPTEATDAPEATEATDPGGGDPRTEAAARAARPATGRDRPASVGTPRARRRAGPSAAADPAATAPVAAPPSAPPAAPAAGAPGAPPSDGATAAVAYMERSDWRGCIRETHRHPRSSRLLGARLNCAIQAGDGAELGRTCDELRAHYPSHPLTGSCASLERAYPP